MLDHPSLMLITLYKCGDGFAITTLESIAFKHSVLKICLVRLACVKHAASVRPEPGSNSPINYIEELNQALNYLFKKLPIAMLFIPIDVYL